MITARNRTLNACCFLAGVAGILLLPCASANAQLTNSSGSPVILKVSDGVAAGRSFSVNGEGFYGSGMDVAIAPDSTGQSPATPPANANHPAIIQTDKDGHFIIARLPAGWLPGVYNVWVANSQG